MRKILRDEPGLMKELDYWFSTYLLQAKIVLSKTAQEYFLIKIKKDIKKLYFPTTGESFAIFGDLLFGGLGIGSLFLESSEITNFTDKNGRYIIKASQYDTSELKQLTDIQYDRLTLTIRGLIECHRDRNAESAARQRRLTSQSTAESKVESEREYIVFKDFEKFVKELENNFVQLLASADIHNLGKTAQEILLNRIKYEIGMLNNATLKNAVKLIPFGSLFSKANEKIRMVDKDENYIVWTNEQDPSELQALSNQALAHLSLDINILLDRYRDLPAEKKRDEEQQARQSSGHIARGSAPALYTPQYNSSNTSVAREQAHGQVQAQSQADVERQVAGNPPGGPALPRPKTFNVNFQMASAQEQSGIGSQLRNRSISSVSEQNASPNAVHNHDNHLRQIYESYASESPRRGYPRKTPCDNCVIL